MLAAKLTRKKIRRSQRRAKVGPFSLYEHDDHHHIMVSANSLFHLCVCQANRLRMRSASVRNTKHAGSHGEAGFVKKQKKTKRRRASKKETSLLQHFCNLWDSNPRVRTHYDLNVAPWTARARLLEANPIYRNIRDRVGCQN